jgi:hypothetical protein
VNRTKDAQIKSSAKVGPFDFVRVFNQTLSVDFVICSSHTNQNMPQLTSQKQNKNGPVQFIVGRIGQTSILVFFGDFRQVERTG